VKTKTLSQESLHSERVETLNKRICYMKLEKLTIYVVTNYISMWTYRSYSQKLVLSYS